MSENPLFSTIDPKVRICAVGLDVEQIHIRMDGETIQPDRSVVQIRDYLTSSTLRNVAR